MRWGLRIAFVVSLAAGFSPAAQAGWLLFESPELGFAGQFPTTPKRAETEHQGVATTTFRAGNNVATCVISVAQFPQAISFDKDALAIRDGFLETVKATATSEKVRTFTRGETQLQAISFEATTEKQNLRSIIIVDDTRTYQVVGGVSKIDGDDAELDACVGGFRLLTKS